MNTDIAVDPVADRQLRAALKSVAGEAPVSKVDWEALRRAIRSDAELPLARRRRGKHRRFPAWAPVVLPALCAAALAAVLLAGDLLKPQPDLQATSLRPMAEQVLGSSISESEWELLLSQQVETEALLLAAVGTTDPAAP